MNALMELVASDVKPRLRNMGTKDSAEIKAYLSGNYPRWFNKRKQSPVSNRYLSTEQWMVVCRIEDGCKHSEIEEIREFITNLFEEN